MVSEDQQQILDIKVKYEDAIYGIIRYKEKIEQLNAAIEDLKQQEKDNIITTNERKVQTEAINATIKEYRYNVRTLQKEIQNEVRTENEHEGSLKQLRAQLSNATKAYDEMSRAERESAKGQEMQEHIQDLIEELKEAEEATGRFQRSVGSYYDSMMKAADDLQNTEFFGFDVVDDTGIGKVMEMGKSVENLKVKIGALKNTALSLFTNPYFLAMAGVAGVGMAFKWFYDYNKGLLEATRLTREFTGYTGDALETMRNSIMATAETMDKDFNEVLSTADALMSQYNLSGEQAMKVINDGFASGADLSGDMLSKIQQYAPTFHDAGISADQLVAILQQTRSGIFSDKGLDIITMASKKIREMSTGTASALDAIGISSKQVQKDLQSGAKTTFDVVQEVSTKMKSFGNDSQEVGAIMKNVFGKQGAEAGIQLIEQLDTMTTDIEEVKKQTGAWGKTQEENIRLHKELNSYMSSMFDMSQKGFGSMIAAGKQFGTKVLIDIMKGLFNTINYFIDWYNESVLLRGVIQTLGIAFRSVWISVKTVAKLIIDAMKQIGRSLKGALDILEGIVTFDLSKAKQGFMEIIDISGLIREGWKDIKGAGSDFGQAFVDGFKNTVNGQLQHLHLSNVDGGPLSSNIQDNNKDKGGASTGGKSKASKTAADKAAKEEAERLKKQQKELQEAIALIQYEYNEKVMDAKKRFLDGMYDSDKEYQDELEALEKDMIARSLDVYVQAGQIGEEKAQEMQEKLLDFMLKAKEQIAQQAKETADKIKEEFERAERETQHNNIMSGNEADNSDEARLERYKIFLQQKIDAEKDHIEVLKELWDEYDKAEQEREEASMQLEEDNQKKREELQKRQLESMSSVISSIGDGLANFFNEQDKSFHNFLKSMLTSLLSAIETAINAYYAKILAEELSNKSWAGVASASAMMALVKIAFAGAKAAVKGFSVGGYVQGSGTGTSDSIPARLSNGESVMTAKATSMFSPMLSAFNQLGGGVPIVVNNSQSQIGMDLLAAAVAKGYMMAPRPVVSVEEISRTQKRVESIERIGRL